MEEPEAEYVAKTDLVRIFFNNLNSELIGLGFDDGGFFDKARIEGKWRPELVEGLATSRAIVPLYSPNYFRSEYCGKEFQVFDRRTQENVGNPALGSDKIVWPVLWKQPVSIPPEVKEYQIPDEFVHKNDRALYKAEGLEYLLKFPRFKERYRRFVYALARKIAEHAERQGAPQVRNVPDLKSLIPPFPGGNKPGVKYVRYLFVAGVSARMRQLNRKCDCYGVFADGRDWQPCFPNVRAAGESIFTRAAKDDGRAHEIVRPPDVLTQLKRAKELKNIVIVAVDPWSLKLPELKSLVEDFDSEEFPTSCVMICWNKNDPETLEKQAELENELKEYFRGRVGRKEHYIPAVNSETEMEAAVKEAFNAIRKRLMELGQLPPADPNSTEKHPILGN